MKHAGRSRRGASRQGREKRRRRNGARLESRDEGPGSMRRAPRSSCGRSGTVTDPGRARGELRLAEEESGFAGVGRQRHGPNPTPRERRGLRAAPPGTERSTPCGRPCGSDGSGDSPRAMALHRSLPLHCGTAAVHSLADADRTTDPSSTATDPSAVGQWPDRRCAMRAPPGGTPSGDAPGSRSAWPCARWIDLVPGSELTGMGALEGRQTSWEGVRDASTCVGRTRNGPMSDCGSLRESARPREEQTRPSPVGATIGGKTPGSTIERT